MLQSRMFIPTLKETPSDAEIISHQLLLRAGYIRQVTSGVYAYLPMAWRVIQNIEQIIREEHEKMGAVELHMPILLPADLWKQSGRYETYGPDLFRLQDRHQRDSILGPTHEETFANIISGEVTSYKRLPLILYQIQTKYRDERRPRFGLLRTREFIMKDAYSFDKDEAGLDKSYLLMKQIYKNIFDRLGLEYKSIIGDGGAMGGSDSMEFMAIAKTGEDTIVYSDESEYAANLEMAQAYFENVESDEVEKDLEKVSTPDVRTMDDLAAFFDIDLKETIKSVLFIADEKPVMVLTRGDHEVNEVKLTNYLGADFLEVASDNETRDIMNAEPGSFGPINAPEEVRIIADLFVEGMKNAVVGANETDHHFINANNGRDMNIDEFVDVRIVQEGERSPDGKGHLQFTEGIEIGHIFKLGTRYSEAMDANILDENGKSKPMVMGSYGIGVSRLVAAMIEQYADESGMVWPKEVAPFHVHLVPVSMKNDEQRELAEELYTRLQEAGYKVLMDDRNERPGVKFADSELFGIPVRVTVGKKAGENIVELQNRKTLENNDVAVEELFENISEILA